MFRWRLASTIRILSTPSPSLANSGKSPARDESSALPLPWRNRGFSGESGDDRSHGHNYFAEHVLCDSASTLVKAAAAAGDISIW